MKKNHLQPSDLPPHLRLTLRQFSTPKKRLRSREIADLLGDGTEPSAVHNRLEKLRRKGILDRENVGTGWLYFRKASK